MQVEIDQSGKVENTSRRTTIGLANGVTKTLLISAREKRFIQGVFRRAGRGRAFVLKVFAALIVLALEDTRKIKSLVIDSEYLGHEQYIRLEILSLIKRLKHPIRIERITFRQIGKKSPAHSAAYAAYVSKRADRVVSAREILRLLLN